MIMTIGIEPLAAMVLLEKEIAPEKTVSGLLLPEEARDKMNIGTILAVGPDVEHVKVGDKVIHRSFGGTSIEWLGIEYLLIKEEDLQAKINE
jgi:chaperonin GroES